VVFCAATAEEVAVDETTLDGGTPDELNAGELVTPTRPDEGTLVVSTATLLTELDAMEMTEDRTTEASNRRAVRAGDVDLTSSIALTLGPTLKAPLGCNTEPASAAPAKLKLLRSRQRQVCFLRRLLPCCPSLGRAREVLAIMSILFDARAGQRSRKTRREQGSEAEV
jgi:hypothetical protein